MARRDAGAGSSPKKEKRGRPDEAEYMSYTHIYKALHSSDEFNFERVPPGEHRDPVRHPYRRWIPIQSLPRIRVEVLHCPLQR